MYHLQQEEISINDTCVLTDSHAHTKEDIIRQLSECLYQEGYVKESFEKAVMTREERFPTGLKIGRYNVAIPHTEPEYVNTSSIAIATLNQRINFQRMDNYDEEVGVDIVLLLALNQGHTHMEALSSIINMCQKEDVIDTFMKTKDKREIVNIVKERLSGGSYE